MMRNLSSVILIAVMAVTLVGCPVDPGPGTPPGTRLEIQAERFGEGGQSLGTSQVPNLGEVVAPGGATFTGQGAGFKGARVDYTIFVPGSVKPPSLSIEITSAGRTFVVEEKSSEDMAIALTLVAIGVGYEYAHNQWAWPELIAVHSKEWTVGVPMGPAVIEAQVVFKTTSGDHFVFMRRGPRELWDSDGDGLTDLWELANSLDPFDPIGENGAQGDLDGDGVPNWMEQLYGTIPYGPFGWDTDGDGFSDGEEIAVGTDPLDPDCYPVIVPDVVGLYEEEAREVIASVGLEVGEVDEAYSDAVPVGTVLSQSPAQGILVLVGSSVNLTVSLGPLPTTSITIVSPPEGDRVFQKGDEILLKATVTAMPEGGDVLWITPWSTRYYGEEVVIEAGRLDDGSYATGADYLLAHIVSSEGISLASGQVWLEVVEASPEEVEVPNLLLLTEEEAREALTLAGLVVGEVTISHQDIPAGLVFTQDPAGGTLVPMETEIDFSVSLGPEPAQEVEVPHVVGLTETLATQVILENHLSVGTIDIVYSNVPAGKVIDQYPTAGALVLVGSSVNLTVSLGPEPPEKVTVPDLIGLTETMAKNAITSAGLKAGTVTKVYSDSVSAGKVVSHQPTAGALVLVGSSVNLTVSLGPEPPEEVKVPNLVGLTESVAKTAITSVELKVGTITKVYSDSVSAGKVVSHQPTAGALVLVGSSVNLTVSLGPSPTPSVTIVSPPEGERIFQAGDEILLKATVTAMPEGGDVLWITPWSTRYYGEEVVIEAGRLDDGSYATGADYLWVHLLDSVGNSIRSDRVWIQVDP